MFSYGSRFFRRKFSLYETFARIYSVNYVGGRRLRQKGIKMKEKQLIEYLITVILERLDDLYDEATEFNQFVFGERTAYVECLEIIQECIDAAQYGLAFKIEGRYPI